MNLSELKTGQHAIIVKVQGHGGFRKRIVEMGFIKGQEVEVLLNAPLQDPVKYKVMGYEVSLRRAEAEMIEIEQYPSTSHSPLSTSHSSLPTSHSSLPTSHSSLPTSSSNISVSLIGNPNCGKTSLFNFASGAHARVGNYSGVTVDATEAKAQFEGRTMELTDLPGTYSLSCYTPEELYVRKHLAEHTPDVIVNVIDASNIERNLYLTTQLVDMDLRVVCALNMYDEFERRGDSVDIDTLQQLLGMPIVKTSFKTGYGVSELMKTIIDVADDSNTIARHIHINYGHEIENAVAHIQRFLKPHPLLHSRYSTRYLALKLLEGDDDIRRITFHNLNDDNATQAIERAIQEAANRIQEEMGIDAETAIMDAKYGFIHGALAEARFHTGTKNDTYRTTHIIDRILSNKYLGLPIFFLLLLLMFETTFVLGQYPMDWIDAAVGWLGNWVGSTMNEGPLRSMIVDGIIGGVGAVIVFLPQILILYTFISFMEDSGYMARAAFIMDRLMHAMGLHGKSFIPLIMGFGCNVPAVMATRTIESRRSRLITMMILPFMSCSARLPIYIMIIGIFFEPKHQPFVMVSLYAIGILTAIIMSNIFSRFIITGEDTPFVMELPPYRWPTPKAIWRHTWEKGKEYLHKMGGIILVASITVWALSYFGPCHNSISHTTMEESFLGRFGKTIEPLFTPQGFNWKLDVSILSGVGAKEIVASTIGVLYNAEQPMLQQMQNDGITAHTAYAFLTFILLYFPCIATIVAIKNETASWRWAITAAMHTSLIAWIASAIVAIV